MGKLFYALFTVRSCNFREIHSGILPGCRHLRKFAAGQGRIHGRKPSARISLLQGKFHNSDWKFWDWVFPRLSQHLKLPANSKPKRVSNCRHDVRHIKTSWPHQQMGAEEEVCSALLSVLQNSRLTCVAVPIPAHSLPVQLMPQLTALEPR